MHERIRKQIAEIGGDRESGATALLLRGLAAVAEAAAEGPEIARAAALELCRAQPSMAGFRTAAAVVVAAADPGAAVSTLSARVRRTTASIARHAVGLIGLRRSGGPLRVVTYSRSSSVEAVLVAAAARETVHVACAEGRPAMEGRALAVALAQRGIPVEVYADGAVGAAMPGADALLVGADAVGPSAAINKVGTAALAALALHKGVPVYVLAGLEKVVPAAVFDALPLTGGDPAEIWAGPRGPVTVRNPYFERVPHQLVSAILTDAGPLTPEDLGSAPLWPQHIDNATLI